MSPGYTPAQAKRLQHRIDKEVAKIEDAASRLRKIVPDADPHRFTQTLGVDGCLEEFRNVARGLKDTVDRRTA